MPATQGHNRCQNVLHLPVRLFPAPLSDAMIDLKLPLVSYLPCSISQLVGPALCPCSPCLPIMSTTLLWALKPSYASAPAAIHRNVYWLRLTAFSLTATAFLPCSLARVHSTACVAKRHCSSIAVPTVLSCGHALLV